MEKNVLSKFDCFSDPATIGPRWTKWLTSFELYVDEKGLIINEGTTAATKQRRRAMLLHLAGPDVQKIFITLTETGMLQITTVLLKLSTPISCHR